MKITLLRGECRDNRSCPNINATDRGTLLVQGYLVSAEVQADLCVGPGEAVVEVSLALLPELASEAAPYTGLHVTERGTVLIRGELVTDQEALAELRLPSGEIAVEIPPGRLPALTVRD